MYNVSELLQDNKKLYLVTKQLFQAVDTMTLDIKDLL